MKLSAVGNVPYSLCFVSAIQRTSPTLPTMIISRLLKYLPAQSTSELCPTSHTCAPWNKSVCRRHTGKKTMQSDLKTTRENRPKEGLNSKLRNQFQSIPLMRMMGASLQTNISAAC
jgi:hypothetical protein